MKMVICCFFYGNNQGQPLETTMTVLKSLYQQLPEEVLSEKRLLQDMENS